MPKNNILRNITTDILKNFRHNGILYLLFLTASLYLLLLVSFRQSDVFYSGDGGLKFMMVKQISAGESFHYITSSQPGWVKEIWERGFFPITEPFVYLKPQGYVFLYPPVFELISAFFYQKFGYTGLYIIPFISTLLLWYGFIRLAIKMSFSTRQTAMLFLLLVFCSPLTFYGAVYWEHTLAMVLLLGGIFFIAYPPEKAWQAAILGIISGLSVWIRPECLLMNLILVCACGLLNLKKLTSAHWIFSIGCLISTAGYLIFNKLEYGAFFGIHGLQVVENKEHFASVKLMAYNIFSINLLLVEYYPVVLLIIPILLARLKFQWPLRTRTLTLLLIVITYCLVSRFIFPSFRTDGGKQWGPRYFLPIIPLVALICIDTYAQWMPVLNRRYKRFLVFFTVLAVGYSFALNTVLAARNLYEDNFNRIRPCLTFIKQQQESVIVVNSEFVTMELGALYREKNFFLSRDTANFDQLLPLLKQHRIDHFIYINDGGLPDGFATILSSFKAKMVTKGAYQVALFRLN